MELMTWVHKETKVRRADRRGTPSRRGRQHRGSLRALPPRGLCTCRSLCSLCPSQDSLTDSERPSLTTHATTPTRSVVLQSNHRLPSGRVMGGSTVTLVLRLESTRVRTGTYSVPHPTPAPGAAPGRDPVPTCERMTQRRSPLPPTSWSVFLESMGTILHTSPTFSTDSQVAEPLSAAGQKQNNVKRGGTTHFQEGGWKGASPRDGTRGGPFAF